MAFEGLVIKTKKVKPRKKLTIAIMPQKFFMVASFGLKIRQSFWTNPYLLVLFCNNRYVEVIFF